MKRYDFQILRKKGGCMNFKACYIYLGKLCLVCTFFILAVLCTEGFAAKGDTTRVSVDSLGVEGNKTSNGASISEDGRYVAFGSGATNLVPGDINDYDDVFVHDRQTGETTLVSVSSEGMQGDYHSGSPSLTPDGRYVAFSSGATNLVFPNDSSLYSDVFVHDRQTVETTRVSVSLTGGGGDSDSRAPSISSVGRYVAFESFASNLVPGDTPGNKNIFVRDHTMGQTTMVSVSSEGVQGNGLSRFPSISAEGRYVAFQSTADNLMADDTDRDWDIYVHDRETGQTTLISVSSDGVKGNDWSMNPSISSDGRYIAFESLADNLITDDTNLRKDIFVYDRDTEKTSLVSVDSSGTQNIYASDSPQISADGRYVAFFTDGSNLLPGLHPFEYGDGIYVHDRYSRETRCVSVNSSGVPGWGWQPSISPDGKYVAFESTDDSLVANDTNSVEDIFVHEYVGPILGPDIKANLSDEPVEISTNDLLSVTITFIAGSYTGLNADWWILARTPFGWYHYDAGGDTWLPGQMVTYQGPLFNLPADMGVVLDYQTPTPPPGAYTFFFGVDLNMNGLIDMDQMYYDSVAVDITP